MPGGAPDPDTSADLLGWARAYASTVDVDVDLDAVSWDVSHRARRRAGVCRHDGGDDVTIALTWEYFESHGWDALADVVRHELVHAWEFQQYGESGHGERFRRKAATVDAPRHCDAFSTPRYRLRCADCDWTVRRYRASRTVTEPGRYRCGDCGGRYAVEHVESGETWESEREYDRVRAALGEDW